MTNKTRYYYHSDEGQGYPLPELGRSGFARAAPFLGS